MKKFNVSILSILLSLACFSNCVLSENTKPELPKSLAMKVDSAHGKSRSVKNKKNNDSKKELDLISLEIKRLDESIKKTKKEARDQDRKSRKSINAAKKQTEQNTKELLKLKDKVEESGSMSEEKASFWNLLMCVVISGSALSFLGLAAGAFVAYSAKSHTAAALLVCIGGLSFLLTSICAINVAKTELTGKKKEEEEEEEVENENGATEEEAGEWK
ncbi:MAG: hypothetical protein LBK29_01550 [Oscillospiraceae bacterium]|jgi:hypothetical protein|nr:hypothetical protein [Oscillospiraceae bacterium]